MPWITLLIAFALVFVLAQQLKHSSDRESATAREVVRMMRQDRDNAIEEARVLRIAISPRLAFTEGAYGKPPVAETPEPAKEPEKKLSVNDRIRAIWLNRRMSTREKMAAITRVSNSKQQMRDKIADMVEKVEQSQSENTSKETSA